MKGERTGMVNLEIFNLEVNTGNGCLYNMVAKGNMKNMIC